MTTGSHRPVSPSQMKFLSVCSAFAIIMADRIEVDDIKPSKGEKTTREPTDAQMKEFSKDFKDFDTNQDGRIDASEIRSVFGSELEYSDFQRFFYEVDSNSDGTISMPEYINYAVSLLE